MRTALWLTAPALVLVGGLAACTTGPSVVDATPPAVSYRVTGNDMHEAGIKAERYCNQYGRRAELDTVNRTDVSGGVAVYRCY
jgi:hypothetical protein